MPHVLNEAGPYQGYTGVLRSQETTSSEDPAHRGRGGGGGAPGGAANTHAFIPHEAGSPFGWIEPEMAQYPMST